MSSYSDDRRWSDTFIPTIKRLVGPWVLQIAPDDDDQNHATDLMVLKAGALRIAARVRRPGYAARYPTQFTIRSRRETGADTELAKMKAGWGDWMFYGHAMAEQGGIYPWYLLDLHAWRWQLDVHPLIKTGETRNGDGTWFRWYDIASFSDDPPLVIQCNSEWVRVPLDTRL